MSVATMMQRRVQSVQPEQSAQPPKKRGLVATWSVVDGKLVCKWSVVEH